MTVRKAVTSTSCISPTRLILGTTIATYITGFSLMKLGTQPCFQSQTEGTEKREARQMNRTVETFRIKALKLAISAALLGLVLLVCSPLTRAQSCGYGTGKSCGDGGKNATPPAPDPAPEPGMLLQLGTGLSALAIVGRRLVARKS
jgi:hypothetical protein